jgi:hypothetical protein
MDSALVAAYKSAKLAGLSQPDPSIAAMDKFRQSISDAHQNILDKRQKEADAKAALDKEKQEAGFILGADGEWYKDEAQAKQAIEAKMGMEIKDAKDYLANQQQKQQKREERKEKIKGFFTGIFGKKDKEGKDDDDAIVNWKPGDPVPEGYVVQGEGDNQIIVQKHKPEEGEITPAKYRSPFHVNDEDVSDELIGLVAEEQARAIKEVYSSPEWKDKRKKEIENYANTPTGLTKPMYEQQQIVITKTKEDAFGENKYKTIEEASASPQSIAQLIESGVLGDEETAALLLDKYQNNKALGLSAETMYKNEQNQARAKINNLASNNENHIEAIETAKQAYNGTAGKVSKYAQYDPDSEFYNKVADFLNPEMPVELQGEGNFVIKSPSTGENLTPDGITSLVNSNLVDANGQTKVQDAINKFAVMGAKDGEAPAAKNTLPPDEDLLGSASELVESAENLASWNFDDLLGNNSSLYKDMDELPEFKTLSIDLDPTKNTPLTEEDKKSIKDAILNPKNPFYDKERNKEILKQYIVERQKSVYNKSNKSIQQDISSGDVDNILNKYGIDAKLYK